MKTCFPIGFPCVRGSIQAALMNVIAILLLASMFSGCDGSQPFNSILIYRDVVQWREPERLSHEIFGEHTVGQSLKADCDGLMRIDVMLQKGPESAPISINWHLTQSPGQLTDIATGSIKIGKLPDRGYVGISFPPIENSAKEGPYYFYIENADADKGQGIYIPYTERRFNHSLINGNLFFDHEPAQGNLAFMTYCQYSAPPGETIRGIFTRLEKDRAFFFIYMIVMAVLFFGWIKIR